MEVEGLREAMINRLKELGIAFELITCDLCDCNKTCPWAYDPYNTDGDCLAKK